jgi:hypothetical protein
MERHRQVGRRSKAAVELYDLQNDPNEDTNIAELETSKMLLEDLSKQLHRGWRFAVPPRPNAAERRKRNEGGWPQIDIDSILLLNGRVIRHLPSVAPKNLHQHRISTVFRALQWCKELCVTLGCSLPGVVRIAGSDPRNWPVSIPTDLWE